ncbi:Por secretion system C-terminal sorting domain-containing protein [Aequorivita viscosa]|uniref:Por secretion system C-terminal sorting domain-containing protein n=2 Tax=Aequorivita viscosa TaxID=797419 RepID=A0A1M6K815_9FLAO|nr:Por secretion system C-terminal sorting domain-containing protein [Aequorivita viscosa]SHJ55136.1 Por secretion system C-terminal sorting domain-containing protein [Aequorivita viscosa]
MLTFKYYQTMNTLKLVVVRFFAITFMLFSFIATAQTASQLKEITASYNKSYLENLASKALSLSKAEKNNAIQYAVSRNIPISYTTENGGIAELQRVLPDGSLLYYATTNADAAISTRVNYLNIGGATGFNLDGQNMTSYVWDGGHPRVTHQEYDGPGGNDRVAIMDIPDEGLSLHYHAAHVVGTITASGVVAQAKGMAPQSMVQAYKWNNDLAEATVAAANGMLVSNHSYGYIANQVPDQWFGAYQIDANEWDDLMFNAPYYLKVKSAGNDGADNTSNGSPLAPNYDKLSGAGTAKNSLVIANAGDAVIDNDGILVSVNISSTSSQGPTDDFRIKPDLAGNGVGLYSTFENADDAYSSISGTSMAAPNVSGALLLLQQHYNNQNGNFMRAATLKGLALHTADDAGPVGPDAVWGWGLMNAKKAAETISLNGSGPIVDELTIAQGQTITYTVNADGINDLIASISWTDRPGLINNALNSPIAALINDLDIRVSKDGDTFYPWRLTSVTSNSNGGDNTKDPFERVDVENASGTYTITITHKGTLVGGSQDFSLIVTGVEVNCTTASVPQNINVNDVTASSASASWALVPGAEYDLRYRKQGSYGWIEVSDITVSNYNVIDLVAETNYELQVRSKCPGGAISDYSETVSFATTAITYCESGSTNSSGLLYLSNVTLNTLNNTSGAGNYTDFTALNTQLMPGQTYTISLTSSSPPPYTNVNSYFSVYIDYNQNGSFDDAGEQVSVVFGYSDNVVTSNFTVPNNVSLSSTIMRVSLSNHGTPGACETDFSYGEVEDYTIAFPAPLPDFIYENGVWTPSHPAGVSTSSDNIHIINGTTVFSSDVVVNNLEIDAGAALNVESVLSVNGDIINNGDLVFVSTATGNGELAPLSGTSVILGNATVQRYMKNKRSYRMVSSAVTTATSIHDNWQEGATSNTDNPNPGFGTHITGSTTDQINGFDGTITGNPSMFTVNVATQMFEAVTNTDVNTLVAGEPYLLFVRGDRSIDLTDDLAAGETVLRATGSLATGTQTQNYATSNAGDVLMFGNPYQSAVDLNAVFAASTNLNTGHYYVYDSELGAHGSYVTVMLPGGTNTSGSVANQFLQPGQGAQAAALAAGATSVVFDEANKAPGNFTSTSRPVSANDMLTVQLYTTENFSNGGPVHDSFGIIFAEGNDNGLTPADAVKPMNFYENLGVNNNGTYLSIEQRELPQAAEVYSLYTTGYTKSDYTLKFIVDGLEANFLYLDDHFTGTSMLLEAGENSYSYHVDTNDALSIATDRFSIRTEQRLGVDDNSLLAGIRLFPNPLKGDTFYINAPKLNGEQLSVSISDLTGRNIYEQTLDCRANTVTVLMRENISSGMYLVTLTNGGEAQTYRLIKD